MFEIGWAELLVIAIVLIVVVGPKDLPRMLRTFGRTAQQMRRMAGDFRRQFDDALREAELDEVRQTISDVKKMNPAGEVRKALNPMKAVGDEIRSTLAAATKAPEPKVPSASAPAQAVEPAKAGATTAAPAVMEPIAASTAPVGAGVGTMGFQNPVPAAAEATPRAPASPDAPAARVKVEDVA